MLRRTFIPQARFCVLLPRTLPSVPYSPITQVVDHFNTQYRSAIATICAACSRGHEVQAILVGPDPPAENLTFDGNTEENNSNTSNAVDPIIMRLMDAYGSKSESENGKFRVALATSPNLAEDPESFIELRSDLFGTTHWVTTINSLVMPGNHCIIDGIGPEVAGALKYALGDPQYNQGVTERGIPVSWNNRDFPTSETLVKTLVQIYASHKMVASLSTTEARLKRAPESSVIPPHVRDANRSHLPSELKLSSPEEAKDASKTTLFEEEMLNEDLFKDFPQELLILSLNSWRQLDISEWFRKRVIAVPKYDGGDESEMCIAAVEDSYTYFQEMFRQKSFGDYSFLCLPPKVKPAYAVSDCESGEEIRSHYQSRSADALELLSETLPVSIFRGIGLFSENILSRFLGWQLAFSDIAGYTLPMPADTIGDTLVNQVEAYLEADYQISNTLFHFRGSEEEKRTKAKQDGALKLGSHLRLTMSCELTDEELEESKEVPKYFNPLYLNRAAKQMEKQYTFIKWKKMDKTVDDDDEDD